MSGMLLVYSAMVVPMQVYVSRIFSSPVNQHVRVKTGHSLPFSAFAIFSRSSESQSADVVLDGLGSMQSFADDILRHLR